MNTAGISKAKELLCCTQLKLYDDIRAGGYSDPQIFSKVFRELTGQLQKRISSEK
jgi:YesN/AraC family two-component response regulator